tara:strand:+ start:1242 stop:1661 length:420 start_codon:yes stop_codon:yes gene_type:complete
MNLFFDILPEEIQQYVYKIRLYNCIMTNYKMRNAQKKALSEIVMQLNFNYNIDMHAIYNPLDPQIAYVTEKCSKILSYDSHAIWWIAYFVRPIERGLILFDNFQADPDSHIYAKTEYACDKLIEILQCRKDPARRHSLS